MLSMPPVVLAAPEIRDNACKLAVGGEPFLPELLRFVRPEASRTYRVLARSGSREKPARV